MKYFIDTEFLEGSQKENFPISLFRKNTPNTIDLISIGIVAEDGREYYAISKDFNLKEAWNRYDEVVNRHYPAGPEYNKVYWIRENVLKPIFDELLKKYSDEYKKALNKGVCIGTIVNENFSYKLLKFLVNKYGKTNKEIAEEIKNFTLNDEFLVLSGKSKRSICSEVNQEPFTYNPEFYAYYADYDWVVFCWLFGKMIDLPKRFPMYCKDLEQILEEKANSLTSMQITDIVFGKGNIKHNVYAHLDSGILKSTKSECLMNAKDYSTPSLKKENEHNALSDARWNKNLYEFLHKF